MRPVGLDRAPGDAQPPVTSDAGACLPGQKFSLPSQPPPPFVRAYSDRSLFLGDPTRCWFLRVGSEDTD